MSLDWLVKKMEEADVEDVEIDIPTGGDFVRGFAGEWTQNVMYRLYTGSEIDFKEMGIKYDHKIFTKSETGIWWYWYQRSGALEQATAAAAVLNEISGDKRNRPNSIWRWEMPTSTMLNYQGDVPVAERFGEAITNDISITGLRSTARTQYHLLFLPSFVQALGLAGGIISEQVYNYDNLIYDPEQVTPEYCSRMVGEIEAKDTKWETGELWNARSEIWAAFGEDNPKAYTFDMNPKSDTNSEELAIPLRVIKTPGIAIWGRIGRIAAPRMPNDKEKENNQFPFGMEVFSQVWGGKQEAINSLGVDDDSDHPAMPAEWSGTAVGDFRAWCIKYVGDNYEGKTQKQVVAAIKKDKGLEGSLALTAGELVPWIEYVMD